jgi:hypothetical protein
LPEISRYSLAFNVILFHEKIVPFPQIEKTNKTTTNKIEIRKKNYSVVRIGQVSWT